MITDGKKWQYLVLISLSALFKGITSSNNGYFYCLNCFHSYRTLNKFLSCRYAGRRQKYIKIQTWR